jgi:hypothetical protein
MGVIAAIALVLMWIDAGSAPGVKVIPNPLLFLIGGAVLGMLIYVA